MRRGLFVTGTDTGVGKTVASAAFMHACRLSCAGASDEKGSGRPDPFSPGPIRYWKPIQTGIEQDDDTAEVRRLGECAPDEILGDGIRLRRPLSPHLAAELAGTSIAIDDVIHIFERARGESTWIVEGAGGALVPINDQEMMIDLMARIGLPVAVVARTALGTINHTLLTLEALRARALAVAGVLLVGDANEENRKAIATYGRVEILGHMPQLNPLTPQALGNWARSSLAPQKWIGRFF